MNIRAIPTATTTAAGHGNVRGRQTWGLTSRRSRVAGGLFCWFIVMAALLLWIVAMPPRGSGDDLAELFVDRRQSSSLATRGQKEEQLAVSSSVPSDGVARGCSRVPLCAAMQALPVAPSCSAVDVLRDQYLLSRPMNSPPCPHCSSALPRQRNADEETVAVERWTPPPSSRSDVSFSDEWLFATELERLDSSTSSPTSLRIGLRLSIRRQSEEDCEAYRATASKQAFTNDETVDRFVRQLFGPDWFEATVVVAPSSQNSGAGLRRDSASGGLVPLLFVWQPEQCRYVSTFAVAVELDDGAREMVFLVDHVHTQWNAVNELAEEAHFDYVLRRLHYGGPYAAQRFFCSHDIDAGRGSGGGGRTLEWSVTWQKDRNVWTGRLSTVSVTVAASGLFVPCLLPHKKSSGTEGNAGDVAVPGEGGGQWVAVGEDRIRRYDTSYLKGYWLTYKTMNHKSYDAVPNYHYDFLGRMNFGMSFVWRQRRGGGGGGDGATSGICNALSTPPPRSICTTRECILGSLRNRVIYFIGDSHMRIFFYGFLSRLGVTYPLDKVWRGDRTDVVASHNVTVHFVASYFLNLSRPSAESMLRDPSHPFVVAGVGQHHSCHCWTARKHSAVVDEALATLLPADDGDADDDDVGSSPPVAAGQKLRRDVAWFGIPAQPYNTHLYRKRPVGQARRDCRNNARHLVYSAQDHRSVAAAAKRIATGRRVLHAQGPPERRRRRRGVWFIDSLQLSLGMQHTSLDGAHYYTWVREAWIDALADALHQSQELHAQL